MSLEVQAPVIQGMFRCVMPVRWGDMDAQRHVNNTVYFRYTEEARLQMFRQAGIRLGENKVGLLVSTHYDFLKPIGYPATLAVQLVVKKVGRTSLHLDTVIVRDDDPDFVYARGTDIVVGADLEHRPQPWTPSELAAMASCFVA